MTIKATDIDIIPIGWQEENTVTQIDFSEEIERLKEKVDGETSLRVWRPGDAYGHPAIIENGIWTVDEFELERSGNGKAQLFVTDATAKAASRWFDTQIRRSIPLGDKVKAKAAQWYEKVMRESKAAREAGVRMDEIMSGGEPDQVLTQTAGRSPEWRNHRLIFVATMNVTTYDEITEAIAAGKLVLARNSESELPVYYLTKSSNEDRYYFDSFTESSNYMTHIRLYVKSDDDWFRETYYIQKRVNLNGLVKFKTNGSTELAVPGVDYQEPLTAGSGISISDNVISAVGGIFIATYGVTTYSEISAAVDAGKVVFARESESAAVSYTMTKAMQTAAFNPFSFYRVVETFDGSKVDFISINSRGEWSSR